MDARCQACAPEAGREPASGVDESGVFDLDPRDGATPPVEGWVEVAAARDASVHLDQRSFRIPNERVPAAGARDVGLKHPATLSVAQLAIAPLRQVEGASPQQMRARALERAPRAAPV